MKIFISSLIVGMEPFRAAARAAVTSLGHEPVLAEDFPAQTASPQMACLQGLRSADLVVLIMGADYGAVQAASGRSPTHEEYLEARNKKPILVFVQDGVNRGSQQAAFLADVQGWQGGFFRASFKDPAALQSLITRAIHEQLLATAAAPLDVDLLTKKASDLLQQSRCRRSGSTALNVAITGGPIQQILRPAELESPALVEALHQEALFGEHRLFISNRASDNGVIAAALFLEQENGARIQVDEQGTLLLRLPLEPPASRSDFGYGMFAIIEETVLAKLEAAVGYAAFVLERIDPTHKLTHVGVAASIDAADYLGWRTQAEQDASPNSGTMGMHSGEYSPIFLSKPRAALRFDRRHLA